MRPAANQPSRPSRNHGDPMVARIHFWYSWFSHEIAPIPKAWVATTCNFVRYKQHERGGHIAAMEVPGELLEDIEGFAGQVWE